MLIKEARIVRGRHSIKRVLRHGAQFGPSPSPSRLTTKHPNQTLAIWRIQRACPLANRGCCSTVLLSFEIAHRCRSSSCGPSPPADFLRNFGMGVSQPREHPGRLCCERKEVKEHEAYQSPTAEAGGTNRTRWLRLWKWRQPRLQGPRLQERGVQVSCIPWCNQTQGATRRQLHSARLVVLSRTISGWRKTTRHPYYSTPLSRRKS